MKTIINLSPTPNQTVSANISDTADELHVLDLRLRTMPDGSMIADIAIDEDWLAYGVRCLNNMPLLLGTQNIGNLYFTDQYGDTDPTYSGLGTQYQLIYDNEYTLE